MVALALQTQAKKNPPNNEILLGEDPLVRQATSIAHRSQRAQYVHGAALDGKRKKEESLIEAGVQVLLGEQAKTDPRARNAKPGDFLDPSIINELHKEAFIKALWATK